MVGHGAKSAFRPTRYPFASRGSFEEGALAALLIVVASIGPVA
ncbi:MAG TPA: hypothetical protein VFQ87_17150 [Bradyrhizobium sp.]|jgi:hypothetical protein|nr:hypothetical protein [Bradyrhizobium sp.]